MSWGSLPPFKLSLLGEIYLITCLQGNWKSVPQQGCILINCTGPLYVQWLFLFSAHLQLVYKDFLDMVVHSGLVLRLKGGTHTDRTTEIRPLGRGAEENGSSPKSSGHLCQTTGGSKVNEI